MTPVSAVIITKNEEKWIARCLASLSWANEIVVVDSGSTDRTVEICNDPSRPWAGRIKVLSRAWTGFKDQRNFSIQAAKNDWVLVVDADEECTPELRERIRLLMSEPHGAAFRAYKVRRVEYFLGKQIHHGIWNPSYQDRFFHRAGVEYVNEIHEYPRFPNPPGEIHEPLLHAPDFGPEKFLQKMNFYTSIEARDRVNAGRRTNWFHLTFSGPAMTFKNLFYYGAYKDGIHGLVVSLLEGISRAVRHIKMWQYQRELERDGTSRKLV